MFAKMLGISKHITTNLFGSSNTLMLCMKIMTTLFNNSKKKMMLEQVVFITGKV